MFKSPCKICLVFPICNSICDKKLYFTAERFCRLLRYRKITAEEGTSDNLTVDLIKDIWNENIKIGIRRGPEYKGADRYKKQRDIVQEYLRTEHPYHNTKYCHKLMKYYGIERKEYANTV
jgi:hypothetical protein